MELGTLGHKLWWRCDDCGMEFTTHGRPSAAVCPICGHAEDAWAEDEDPDMTADMDDSNAKGGGPRMNATIATEARTLVRAMRRFDATAQDDSPGIDWLPTWIQIQTRHDDETADVIWREAWNAYEQGDQA